MDTNKIINSQIFGDVEDWNAYTKLADAKQDIINQWGLKANTEIRARVAKRPYSGWSVKPWGSDMQTIKCYLTEFGEDSIFLLFKWGFELHLYVTDLHRYDGEVINTLLKTEDYSMILGAFNKIDRQFELNSKAMHYRNFNFNSLNDGRLTFDECAWYAGNRTEEFTDQCIKMIEKFTCDPIVTNALRELHLRSKKEV
ncbi:MAG: hypothetical protein ACSHXL_00845 [Bacteroidota bacterium]